MADNRSVPVSTLARMVDMKIPLPWLLGGFIFGVGSVLAMYNQLQSLTESMRDVQSTLKSTNAALFAITAEQSLQKYRIEQLESAARK